MSPFLFSSESVSEGHPDKICDQISDAILDRALEEDPKSRVAVESFATTGLVLVAGEMTTKAQFSVEELVRKTLKEIGYIKPEYGIDAETCAVLVSLHEQSADIAQGVDENKGLYAEQGAGDQGIMFGYACKQTDSYMPLPITLSHELLKKLSTLRRTKQIPYLRPDAKSQVTVEYNDNREPIGIKTVVISTQHDPDIEHQQIRNDVIEQCINKVLPSNLDTSDLEILINPTGRFVQGGPHADAGLTGRKIIVDTYGGWVSHGGGCFSGKDGTKVDRSAAYMARYVAKNLVAADLMDECEIQLAYAIGVPRPVSIYINDYGTAKQSLDKIKAAISQCFDLSPYGIVQALSLRTIQYKPLATYGHIGREDLNVPWERTDKVDALRQALGLPVEVSAV